MDERLHLVFDKAPAHCDLFRCAHRCRRLLYFIYIIIDHFTRAAAPIGWASTTALLLILGGVILLVLGLIGEYIGRIFMCVNASPQYVERSVIRRGDGE